jgi:hypothetical protein
MHYAVSPQMLAALFHNHVAGIQQRGEQFCRRAGLPVPAFNRGFSSRVYTAERQAQAKAAVGVAERLAELGDSDRRDAARLAEARRTAHLQSTWASGIHEAGHIVAAMRLGIQVVNAGVTRRQNTEGRWLNGWTLADYASATPHHRAAFAAAGELAEARYCCGTDAVIGQSALVGTDAQVFESAINSAPWLDQPSIAADAWNLARGIITDAESIILSLARELVAQQEMSAAGLASFFGGLS